MGRAFFRQALQMALHLTWFLGLVFIGLSLYATQLLSVPRQEERGQAGKYGSRDSPNITFFTAPRPFEGLQGERQYLALHSWLRLSPHVQVVLLGYHPSLQSVAMQLSPQVKVNSDVDFTFLGTPFFHNMVARASNSNSDIVVLIDPEFVLLEDFMVALEYTHSYLQHDWLMVAKPKKVDDFPFHLEATKSFWLDVMNQTLDEEQGLPVFRVSTSVSVSFNDCHFGTKCFQKVTKTKSRTVLRILHLGYNVLFSDVDVYWFKSPLEYLKSFGPKTIAAQSDQWNETEPCNEPRRLNSGFYFAWSENATITVFEKIVKHGAKSRMSEQPSFYDILCGEGGRNRIGDTQCMEPETNVTVYFLDRAKFPNGAFRGLWEKKNVNKECLNQGCFVLHNNWISGREKKLKRQIAARLWDYDTKHRFCSRSWQGLELNPIF